MTRHFVFIEFFCGFNFPFSRALACALCCWNFVVLSLQEKRSIFQSSEFCRCPVYERAERASLSWLSDVSEVGKQEELGEQEEPSEAC